MLKGFAVAAAALLGLSAGIGIFATRDSHGSGPVVTRIGDLSVERAAHQATVLESGEVLITGGCGGTGCTPFHRSAELYDPSARRLRTIAPMRLPRASHTATLLPDGRVLVAGGCSTNGPTADAELYDAAAGRWVRAGDMTEPRCSHIAVPLRDGRVFVMGGGGGRLGDLATAEVFDPATSTFSSLGRMRHNHYLATALTDGRILLTGGQDSAGGILASAEIFDPPSGRFVPTGGMGTARVKHAAALLPDGRVLVVGGSDRRGYDGRFNSTEVYDPASGRFSRGPSLREGRHKIRDAVAVLPSGAILIAGGAVQPELYDPVDGIFLPVEGNLSGPQMFATTSVLRNGEVLVVGGYDERVRSSAAVWLVTFAR